MYLIEMRSDTSLPVLAEIYATVLVGYRNWSMDGLTVVLDLLVVFDRLFNNCKT